jgi:DNA-binding transcriptional MerR regulator
MLKRTSSQGGRMSDSRGLLAIGELARRTGLASSALRYYERVGLLSPAGRAGGRRYYGTSSPERVALIHLCQEAGFTLREIRALVAAGGRKSRSWTRLVEAKLRELETRIARAEGAKALVQHALACPHRNLLTCSNFRAALAAHLVSPGHDPVTQGLRRARVESGGRQTTKGGGSTSNQGEGRCNS